MGDPFMGGMGEGVNPMLPLATAMPDAFFFLRVHRL